MQAESQNAILGDNLQPREKYHSDVAKKKSTYEKTFLMLCTFCFTK